MSLQRATVTLHADGACYPNPGIGGWGVVLQCDGVRRELAGAERETTNNRMELTAAIRGLEALTEPSQVHVVTDSQYLQRGATAWVNKWRRNGWYTGRKNGRTRVVNRDLWERLLALMATHEVTWSWVRGHGDDVENNRADELAVDAMLQAGSGGSYERR